MHRWKGAHNLHIREKINLFHTFVFSLIQFGALYRSPPQAMTTALERGITFLVWKVNIAAYRIWRHGVDLGWGRHGWTLEERGFLLGARYRISNAPEPGLRAAVDSLPLHLRRTSLWHRLESANSWLAGQLGYAPADLCDDCIRSFVPRCNAVRLGLQAFVRSAQKLVRGSVWRYSAEMAGRFERWGFSNELVAAYRWYLTPPVSYTQLAATSTFRALFHGFFVCRRMRNRQHYQLPLDPCVVCRGRPLPAGAGRRGALVPVDSLQYAREVRARDPPVACNPTAKDEMEHLFECPWLLRMCDNRGYTPPGAIDLLHAFSLRQVGLGQLPMGREGPANVLHLPRHKGIGLAVWHGVFELHNHCRKQGELEYAAAARIFETAVSRATRRPR